MQALAAKVETIITEEYAVELDSTGRGCFATVKYAGSPFDGMYAFASTQSTALRMLQRKVEETKYAH